MGKPRFVDRAGSYFYASKKRRAPTVPGSSAENSDDLHGGSSFLRQPDPGAFGLSVGHTEDIGTWGTVPTDENGLLSDDIVSQPSQNVKQEWAAFREYIRRKITKDIYSSCGGLPEVCIPS